MLKIGIIVGSTRPGRKAAAVAKWVLDILKSRKDAEFEIVDIEDYKLPLLDEPVPPIMRQYSNPHTKTWSEKIASLDAYIFVTPEYNTSTSAALRTAIKKGMGRGRGLSRVKCPQASSRATKQRY